MLNGYGSNTRDNTSGNFKHSKILAEQLVKKDIASLRFDSSFGNS